MTYQQRTGKTIQECFERFHRNNPHVYDAIKTEALKLINNGATRISIKRVGNDVRFDYIFFTNDPDLFEAKGTPKRYKISDAYLSRYNRLFLQDYPQFAHKLEMRSLRSH